MQLKFIKMAKKAAKLTAQEAEQAASDFFEAENELLNLETEKQKEILAIQNKYTELANAASAKSKAAEKTLATYCKKNRATLLTGDAKSGTIGRIVYAFKFNKGKLEPTENSTWESVLAAVESKLPDYVRTTIELDKLRLLADAETMSETFAEIGLKVVKKEHFTLSLKD